MKNILAQKILMIFVRYALSSMTVMTRISK